MVTKRYRGNNQANHRKQRGGAGDMSWTSELDAANLFEALTANGQNMHPRPRVLHDAASFDTRLEAVEEDVRDLKRTFEAGFAGLHAKLDNRSQTSWPMLSLGLATIVAVGTLAYWPVREKQQELREEIRSVSTEARRITENATAEGLNRDRRFLDMLIKVQMDVARMDGARGRN
jgi:hypothetical protein